MQAIVRTLATCVASLVIATSAVAADDDAVASARALLSWQRDAWNRADIDGFMQGYWRSDQLRFAGGDAWRSGWHETLDRYRKTYPDAAAMGRLDFDLVEVRALSPDVVYVFGKWSLALDKPGDGAPPHGLFTLLVERKDGRWVVTRDHTSAAER